MTVNFINRDGQKITVKAAPGDSLLDVVIEQNLDIDGFGESPLNTHAHAQIYAHYCMHALSSNFIFCL